jgi:rhamnogalacturonan endolyase
MHYKVISLALTVSLSVAVMAQTNNLNSRALWASINDKKDASLGDYQQHTGKVLVTWRMLPGDDATTGFDLYRAIGTAAEKKIATNIRNRTCFQDASASKTADNHYRLTYSGSDETLSTFTLTKAQVSGGLPTSASPWPTRRTCMPTPRRLSIRPTT